MRSEPVSPSLQHAQGQTKQALFALSAAPKAKLLDGDQWRTAHRKAEGARRDNYNSHWLVQEAEFRRLHPQTSSPSTPPRTDDRSGLRVQNGHTALNGEYRWNKDSSPNVVRGPPKIPDPPRQNVQCSPRDPPSSERKSLDGDRHIVTSKADPTPPSGPTSSLTTPDREPGMLSVSGKKKCSHCAKELGKYSVVLMSYQSSGT